MSNLVFPSLHLKSFWSASTELSSSDSTRKTICRVLVLTFVKVVELVIWLVESVDKDSAL